MLQGTNKKNYLVNWESFHDNGEIYSIHPGAGWKREKFTQFQVDWVCEPSS